MAPGMAKHRRRRANASRASAAAPVYVRTASRRHSQLLGRGLRHSGAGTDGIFGGPQRQFVAIDTGWNYSCGLRADGITTCWGDSDSDTGRYGDHGREWPPEGERFSSISTGSSHTCGLGTRDGSVVCWGENLNGQAFPPDDERFAAIDTGSSDTCGIRLDGTWGCWGFVSGVSGGHYVPAPDPDERLLPSRTAHSTCAGCVRMVLLCAGAVTAMARHRPQQLRGEPARTSHISKIGNYCSFYARNWLCSVSQGFWKGIYIGF